MLIRIPLAALALCLAPHFLAAQVAGVPERPLPDSPFVIDTAEAGQVRVTPMKGLELPWDLAFLPNGDMLVTERTAHALAHRAQRRARAASRSRAFPRG